MNTNNRLRENKRARSLSHLIVITVSRHLVKTQTKRYDNKKSCGNKYARVIWNYSLFAAPPGKLINLDFRDMFDVEYSEDCRNDYLEVRDGAHGYNDIKERRFCGRAQFPPLITSSDRHLWIYFKSDENIELRGFKAVYYFTDRPQSSKCVEFLQFLACFFRCVRPSMIFVV